MADEEERNIDLMIAGRSYSLRIKRKDELNIRKIADEINTKVKNLQLSYTRKDKQDCLCIALLTYAVDNYKLKHQTPADDEDTADRLDQLTALLDEYV